MTHDPRTLLNAEYHHHEPDHTDSWNRGYQDGIGYALHAIEAAELSSLRPLQELQDEVSEYRDFWANEDPGLADLLDNIYLVLETITGHEYDRDYVGAVAEAVRVLQLRDIAATAEGEEL